MLLAHFHYCQSTYIVRQCGVVPFLYDYCRVVIPTLTHRPREIYYAKAAKKEQIYSMKIDRANQVQYRQIGRKAIMIEWTNTRRRKQQAGRDGKRISSTVERVQNIWNYSFDTFSLIYS